jgi:hypothetical protein
MAKRPTASRAGPLAIKVHCEMDGCRAVTTLHFDEHEPYLHFTRDAKDWIISEDEEERVSFLCPRCSEPIRRDIQNDIARQEQALAASLPREGAGEGQDSEEEDSVP